jgi:hypothetical protein
LRTVIDFLRTRDVLTVTSIDRLTQHWRPSRHPACDPIDTRRQPENAFGFAEYETNLRRER